MVGLVDAWVGAWVAGWLTGWGGTRKGLRVIDQERELFLPINKFFFLEKKQGYSSHFDYLIIYN